MSETPSFVSYKAGMPPPGRADVNPYARKLFLIIDSVPEMQRALAMTLASFGAERVEFASRAQDALAKLGHYEFDVVLCDYDLGNGYDGLYLFEEARERNLLRQSCVFMIVTGERRAQRVVSAAEMAPDGYLLKPFTGEQLRQRLDRALRRRLALAAVDDDLMHHDYMSAIDTCSRRIAEGDEFALDFMKLKGQLSMKIGDFHGAQQLYLEVLRIKPLTWAKLGLGKALTELKSYDQARLLFEEVLADHDRVMEAYDWLARIHEASHDGAAAQAALQRAVELSPVVFRRQKELAEVAEQNGDLASAEAACSATLDLARYSWHRNPALYAQLARVQLAREDSTAAVRTLTALRRDYKYNATGEWMADIVDSQLQFQQRHKDKAAQLLASAIERRGSLAEAPGSDALMEFARSCYQQGQDHAGDEAARELVRNNHDDEALLARLGRMFDQAGRSEQGRQLISANVQSVVDVNNQAVREAKAGRYDEAIALFSRAHRDMPGNIQIMLNMSNAVIAQLHRQGWHESHVRHAHDLLGRVREHAPANGKFQKIMHAWNALMAQQGHTEWQL